MIVTPETPPSIRLSGPGWRERWALGNVERLSEAADCTRRRVGCIIYDASWLEQGSGYNGRAPGLPGCLTAGACPRGQRTYIEVAGLSSYAAGGAGECDARHAEANAVARAVEAGRSLVGALAVITDEPCPGCRELLASHGVAEAIWPGGSWTPSDTIHENAQVKRPATRGGESPRG